MASNSSSSTGGQSVFSLDSQAAVMQLLAAIRASEISAADKNELRDLVFLYANGGHDPSVKIALDQKIKQHNITVAAVTPKPTEAPKEPQKPRPIIGLQRSAPQFKTAAAESTTTQAPKAVAESKEPDAKEKVVEQKPQPTPAPAAAPAPAPVPKPDLPTPPPTPVKATAPQPTPAAAPAPVNEQGATPQQPSPAGDANLKRIREIKALVNEKVGNPVHLVELQPDLGREYMAALLEAMKKVNTGAVADSAMSTLETVYQKIERLDVNASATPPTPVSDQGASQPAPAPVTQPPVSQQTTPAVPSKPEPSTPPTTPAAPEVNKQDTQPASTVPVADVSKVVNSMQPKPAAPKPAPVPPPPPTTPKPAVPPIAATPTYTETKEPQRPANVPIAPAATAKDTVPKSVTIQSSPKSGFATEGTPEPETKPIAAPRPPVTPLSAIPNPLQKQTKEPEKTPAAPADPLHTPAVDSGLEQLLNEWPIFKKSGLFGTGPHGREHPLYKRVAGLQIPLLLAGRFEGATQEIKQSITDYMNGWRYEQGLIYEQGENFEHYLRRVIKHILDLQNGKM